MKPLLRRLTALLLLGLSAPAFADVTVPNFVGTRTGLIGTLTITDPIPAPSAVLTLTVMFRGRPIPMAPGTVLQEVRFKTGATERRFLVVRPAKLVGKPRSMMVFHGLNSDPEGMAVLAKASTVIAARGLWAVMPAGINGKWNVDPQAPTGVDDFSFVDRVLDVMTGYFKLDGARVFATGMSLGGFMTNRLACERADRFAGFAPVGGTMTRAVYNTCSPSLLRPLMIIHGTSDPLIPYSNPTNYSNSGVVPTFTLWQNRHLCTASALKATNLPDLLPDGMTTTLQRNAGCGSGSEVRLYTINGGGHTWPSSVQYMPEMLIGKTTYDFDATVEMLNFFATLVP